MAKILVDKETGEEWKVNNPYQQIDADGQWYPMLSPIPKPAKSLEEEVGAELKEIDPYNAAPYIPPSTRALCRVLERRFAELKKGE